jgi:hypothetical protein
MPAGVCKPASITSRACATCSAVSLRGRPTCFPRRFAAVMPAFTRSTINVRSNSASAPKMWRISLPPIVVSIASESEAKPAPLSPSWRTVSIRCGSERPSRSSWPLGRGTRDPLVLEHLLAASPGQHIPLQVQRLLIGGDACVANLHEMNYAMAFCKIRRKNLMCDIGLIHPIIQELDQLVTAGLPTAATTAGSFGESIPSATPA